MKRTGINMKMTLMMAGTAVLLAACGGDGGGSSGSGSGGGASASTGVLSDSPVAGVSYVTSGDHGGTTDAEGRFDYDLGDTVTFTLGGLEIGQYTPQTGDEVVTPIQLAQALPAADQAHAVTNLLVLLQSLDEDGNPENGITINEATSAALEAGSLDFTADPEFFKAEPALIGALPEGNSVVSPDDALDHFEAQYFSNLAGVYYTENYQAVLRINSDGGYIQGQLGYDESEAELGIEWGGIILNPYTATVSPEVAFDSQGGIGAGFDGSTEDQFVPTQNGLRILTPDEDVQEHHLMRLVAGSGNSIVGAWAVATRPVAYDPATEIYTREPISDAEALITTQQFVFFADGTFVMLDPVGDDEGTINEASQPCGGPGVERGTYTFSNNQLVITGKDVDTNGCGGIGGSLEVSINGNTMIWDLEGYSIPFELRRVVTQVH